MLCARIYINSVPVAFMLIYVAVQIICHIEISKTDPLSRTLGISHLRNTESGPLNYNMQVSSVHPLNDLNDKRGQVGREMLQLSLLPKLKSRQPTNWTDGKWQVILSHEPPYTRMAPHLDVVWARGWYNVYLPPDKVPIEYYNMRGRLSRNSLPRELHQYFSPTMCGNVWVRIDDIKWWTRKILPKLECNVTLISSDGYYDVPTQVKEANQILSSPLVQAWYSTNIVDKHPKLRPLPLGLGIHYGFEGSPDSVHTVETMVKIRRKSTPFLSRERTILYDTGTMAKTGVLNDERRVEGRQEAKDALSKCGNVKVMPKGNQLETFPRYASHQFAVAPVGVGWDTYRFWEYLFFGTVPIVKSSPIDDFLIDAHVPVVIIKDWSEVCSFTGDKYDAMVDKYESWVANAHYWLKPSLWVPRDQEEMDRLCDVSPGCSNSITSSIS